jgi:hypothetical protein
MDIFRVNLNRVREFWKIWSAKFKGDAASRERLSLLTMRLCLWRIVFHTPRQSVRKCVVCRTSQFIPLSSQIRGYSDIVKDPDQIDNSPEGVQSTGTVSDDPEGISVEYPETQQPHSSPIPPHPPSTMESRSVKPPIHFRMVEPQKGRRGLLDLQKAMKETSLRKRLGWSNPLLGVNPAYDMAIAFLTQDRKEKIRIIKHLENRIAHERRSMFFQGGSADNRRRRCRIN